MKYGLADLTHVKVLLLGLLQPAVSRSYVEQPAIFDVICAHRIQTVKIVQDSAPQTVHVQYRSLAID